MLGERQRGYAVVDRVSHGISLSDEDLETCKRYCHPGFIVVEAIPSKYGFSITFRWFEPYRFMEWNKYSSEFNLWKLHIRFEWKWQHKYMYNNPLYTVLEHEKGI